MASKFRKAVHVDEPGLRQGQRDLARDNVSIASINPNAQPIPSIPIGLRTILTAEGLVPGKAAPQTDIALSGPTQLAETSDGLAEKAELLFGDLTAPQDDIGSRADELFGDLTDSGIDEGDRTIEKIRSGEINIMSTIAPGLPFAPAEGEIKEVTQAFIRGLGTEFFGDFRESDAGTIIPQIASRINALIGAVQGQGEGESFLDRFGNLVDVNLESERKTTKKLIRKFPGAALAGARTANLAQGVVTFRGARYVGGKALDKVAATERGKKILEGAASIAKNKVIGFFLDQTLPPIVSRPIKKMLGKLIKSRKLKDVVKGKSGPGGTGVSKPSGSAKEQAEKLIEMVRLPKAKIGKPEIRPKSQVDLGDIFAFGKNIQ